MTFQPAHIPREKIHVSTTSGLHHSLLCSSMYSKSEINPFICALCFSVAHAGNNGNNGPAFEAEKKKQHVGTLILVQLCELMTECFFMQIIVTLTTEESYGAEE